jgi:hypothetical protein
MRWVTNGPSVLGVALAVGLLAGCATPPRTGIAVAPVDTLAVEPFGPVFEEARAVAADGAGRLYVVDAGAATVTVLSPTGLPLNVLGGPGTGDYAFLDPSDIDPTNGLVLVVADTGNGRLQRFSYDGRLIDSLPVPSDLGDGDAGQREFRDTPTSDRRSGQGRPTAVAAAVTGETYAVEEVQGLVLRWDERRRFDRVIGGLEEDEGALSQPTGVAVGPDGRLFVADRGHAAVLGDRLVLVLPHEVLLYSLEGRRLDAFAVPTPAPLVGVTGTEDRLMLLTPTRLFVTESLR